MLRKLKLLLAAAAILVLLPPASQADSVWVVYTGASYGPASLSVDNWYAAQFTTTQAYIVTSVEGFMHWGGGGTELTAAILNNDAGGSIPGTTRYTQAFNCTSSYGIYYAATNLSWYLPAGTYWVAFEVLPSLGQNFLGSMEQATSFQHPVALYPVNYFADYYDSSWHNDGGGLGRAIRIYGETPVPLPPAAWFLASGLLGLAGLRLRRRK